MPLLLMTGLGCGEVTEDALEAELLLLPDRATLDFDGVDTSEVVVRLVTADGRAAEGESVNVQAVGALILRQCNIAGQPKSPCRGRGTLCDVIIKDA